MDFSTPISKFSFKNSNLALLGINIILQIFLVLLNLAFLHRSMSNSFDIYHLCVYIIFTQAINNPV